MSVKRYGVRVINPDTGVVCWVYSSPVYRLFFFSLTPRPYPIRQALFYCRIAKRFYPSAKVVGLK